MTFVLAGSHHSLCDGAVLRALGDGVLYGCERHREHLDQCAAPQELVELLWALAGVAVSLLNTHTHTHTHTHTRTCCPPVWARSRCHTRMYMRVHICVCM